MDSFACGPSLVMVQMVVPVQAASGPSIHRGGSAEDMTRFTLAIDYGVGHFEGLLPA